MKVPLLVKPLFLMLFFLALPAWANVGYVLTFSGPSDDFELLRNSKRMLMAKNQPLEQGDKICVLKKSSSNGTIDNSVTIALGAGELVTLTYKDTHYDNGQRKLYPVEASTVIPTVLGNLKDSLIKWFDDLQKHHVHLISIYSKGEQQNSQPLKIPLLATEQKLLAGKNTLSLGWLGGKPPYRVQLMVQGSKEQWTEDHLQTATVTFNFKDVSLKTGHYLVEVSDANQDKKQSVKHPFEVVADSEILQDEAVKAIQTLPESSRRIWLASWFAQRPEWRLEAYQQVAPIADQSHPALLVKEGLISGK